MEAVDQALKAKYGRACSDWRTSKLNTISPNGNAETKSPECGGVNYWFHSGNEFTTQAAWTAYDNQLKEQACTKNRSDALSQKKKGKYTYGPTPGPDPCGKVVWLCNGSEYSSQSAYETSSCYSPPSGGGGGGNNLTGERCRNGTIAGQFRKHKYCALYPKLLKDDPMCKCK